MWKPGDIVVWRGIYRNQFWRAQATILVKDSPDELVLALLPGAEGMAEQDGAKRKKNGKRRWDFKEQAWELVKFHWHTNRLLLILEPQKYYMTALFWNNENNKFLGYYINFQLPFKRSYCGLDSLDLELDLIIKPDLTWEWKDLNDYQKAVESGIIFPKWIVGIEAAKPEVINRLEKHQYPFDGSWLDWLPDPAWLPPKLPQGWDTL
ncbi:MAG TPA: DUF402 domain-containing protein [Anaerolineales bacterium]|nr:DUF402 domain-containing protein [Anaerolineales bacterium]